MKVTKRGKPPKDLIWKGKCYRCMSEVEATQDELRIHSDYKGTFGYAMCPVCDYSMTFQEPEQSDGRD